jgi:hypothetical protein
MSAFVTPPRSRSACHAFARRQREARRLLAALSARVDSYPREEIGDGPVHWGHVGDLARLCDALTAALGHED